MANWDGIDFEAAVMRELSRRGCRFKTSRSLDQCEKVDLLLVGVEGERDFHRSIPCQITLRRDHIGKMLIFFKKRANKTQRCRSGVYVEALATCGASRVAEHLLRTILQNNMPFDGKTPKSRWLWIGHGTDIQSKPLIQRVRELRNAEKQLFSSTERIHGEIYAVRSWGFLIQDENGHTHFCYDHDIQENLRKKLGVERPSVGRIPKPLHLTVPVTFIPGKPRQGAKHPHALTVAENSDTTDHT